MMNHRERHERRLKRLAAMTHVELRADIEKHRLWIWNSIRLPSPATHRPLVDEVLLRANSIRHAEEELARRRSARDADDVCTCGEWRPDDPRCPACDGIPRRRREHL
jgi:hypothetical protein